MRNTNLKKRLSTFFIVFTLGIFLFFWGLGSTGLVDETPPLFAAAGRAMSESGDWITPKVNGIFRFDKPPLIYWLMGFFYSLPNNEGWDSLGTISARFPSAFSSLVLMVLIGDTICCWPQKGDRNLVNPVVASLGFALSPLIIIWSRTAVSDALLCGTLGVSLLLFWRTMASNDKNICITPWIFLGLSILTKGPVAIILATLTITSFLSIQKNWKNLLSKISLLKGLTITALISLPWYIIELFKEGKPFWDSFFGYHNFQRYTSVVNNHSEPIWFFLYIMLLGSMPFSPFLFHGIFEAFKEIIISFKKASSNSESLYVFSFCWLGSVLIFFSVSATKLPSYWLPALPASAILISCSFAKLKNQRNKYSYPLFFSFLILTGLSVSFFVSDIWLNLINDPEMPNLSLDLLSSKIIFKSRLVFSFLASISFILFIIKSQKALFFLQLLFLIGQSFLMLPIRKLADSSRQLPLREISEQIINVRDKKETLAMIGIRKPSLHFYSRQIVFYEPNSEEGLINLYERLNLDRRSNYYDTPDYDHNSFLLVIDKYSIREQHWSKINHQKLGVYGIYNLWRIKKDDLKTHANQLVSSGFESNWQNTKAEKF